MGEWSREWGRERLSKTYVKIQHYAYYEKVPVIPSWGILIDFNFRRTSGTNRNTIRDAQRGLFVEGNLTSSGRTCPEKRSPAKPPMYLLIGLMSYAVFKPPFPLPQTPN